MVFLLDRGHLILTSSGLSAGFMTAFLSTEQGSYRERFTNAYG